MSLNCYFFNYSTREDGLEREIWNSVKRGLCLILQSNVTRLIVFFLIMIRICEFCDLIFLNTIYCWCCCYICVPCLWSCPNLQSNVWGYLPFLIMIYICKFCDLIFLDRICNWCCCYVCVPYLWILWSCLLKHDLLLLCKERIILSNILQLASYIW